MRISRINIESFGKLRDRVFELSPGLNVFYGPNESGKTTTMEFVRSTLSPTRVRRYPERNKKDSGTIEYDDWGVQKKRTLEGQEELPACLEGMDPNLYRSIFAMNREGLDQIDTVIGTDIQSKFLTIPGGETMPKAIQEIEDERDRLMGRTSTSQSRINAIKNREDRLFLEMGELRTKAEAYTQLSEQTATLENRLAEIKEGNRSNVENNELFAKIESQRAAYNSLQSYRAKEAELKNCKTVSDEDRTIHDELASEVEKKRSAFETINSTRSEQIARLPGGNENLAMTKRQEIEHVLGYAQEYQTRALRLPPMTKKSPLPKILAVVVMMAAIAAVMLIPDIEMLYRGIAAAAIGAGIVLFLFLTRTKVDPIAEQNAEWVRGYSANLVRLSGELGIYSTDPISLIRNLGEIMSLLSALDSSRQIWGDRQLELLKAENKLQSFLVRYGGEEGYKKAIENTGTLQNVRSSIDALSSSIRKSGVDPDAPLPEVKKIEYDTTEQDNLSTELGTLRQRMRQSLDTERLDTLIDESYIIKAERKSVLRQGAVAIMASIIAGEACSQIYETVHPDVVSTADRYLSLMTSGRYRLDLDPRKSEISVMDGKESKNHKQWSSGLRAQVLLSLKLALAKEMGNGEVPIILDDVLLPFDKERKAGACEALESLADEMQILLFTCDDDVMETLKLSEKTRTIAL